MQTIAFHHVKTLLHKPRTRVFSSTPRQSQLSRSLRSGKLIKTLWKDTRDPVWGLVDALHARKDRLRLSAALVSYGISLDEFYTWKSVIFEPDITSAMATLQSHGFTVVPPVESESETVPSPSPRLLQHPPSWVVLYLVAFKVRTSQHALGPQLDLTYAHLAAAPQEIQGPLLIFTILNLIRFNLLLPMRRVIDTFLTIPIANPSLEFNLLLQIIAWNPLRSTDVASAIVALLKTMQSRQLNLSVSTYDVLLKDRFITLQLTKYLNKRMIEENVTPTASHLEAYLRIFARHGAIHDAEEYYKTIHDLPAAKSPGDLKDTHARAATLLVAAQRDPASAFGFLRKLVTPENLERDRPPHLVIRHRMRRRAMIDAYDFTAALSVAARDRSKGGSTLITMFERAQARPYPIRLTAASYTVLIRGLLVRESSRAVEYWRALEATGLPIDRKALSVGLRALMLGGMPHKAFQTLQKYAAPNEHIPRGIYQLRQPLRLHAADINEIMVGLTRARRPDVVFKLWDHMEELYGVLPDARTLSILLHAARVAAKLDDSFSGAMAHLALRNPFRTRHPVPVTRDSIVSSIKEILFEHSGKLKPYASGIWNDQPPMEVARNIFLQAIFGNSPTASLGIDSPAHAIRTSVDDDGMRGIGLPRFGPDRTPFIPPPGLLTLRGETHYPSIIVSNEVCMRYLYLLEAMSRAAEVPLLLAWMRELKITPKRELLAMALILWSEVSVQAPLIEAWSGGVERNEYTRLVEWIQDWVGPKWMPNEGLLDRWRHIIARNRAR